MRRLAVLLPLALLAGCGAGDRIVETRDVAPYDRLAVSESVDVRVVPGDGEQVRVAGEEAELVVWSPDYDGKGKALVRFRDGGEAIVGGSRVER